MNRFQPEDLPKQTPRTELEALPERMRDLPIDARGYPVPFFVHWINGEPEFRGMDGEKWLRCVKEKLCWVCGSRLGVYNTFAVGPMCGITRTSSEPPSHMPCARWSARNCPFLSRPHMRRREDEVTDAGTFAGYMVKRNPGVTLLWTTRTYRIFDDGEGRPLIEMGEPEDIEFYAEGKPATRAQIDQSVTDGLPNLESLVQTASERAAFQLQQERFTRLLDVFA